MSPDLVIRRRVPQFPLTDPGGWDEFTLLAGTIFLEAEGEPDEGKLAVGYVILRRVEVDRRAIHQVILGPEGRAWGDGKPWEAWSCWNDDYRPRAEARLASADGPRVEAAWRAAAAALWGLAWNPAPNAYFYLNPAVTLRSSPDHRFPVWAADPADPTGQTLNTAKVVAVIEHHTFMLA